MKTTPMDCPNCGYFIDVEERNGIIKCRYCGSLLSYNQKKHELTIESKNPNFQEKRNNSVNNFIILECPGCNANLEIDQDHLLAYCPYCGKKLFYNMNGLSYVITEKEKTKRANVNNEFKLDKIRIEHEEKRKDDLHNFLLAVIPSLIFILLSIVIFYFTGK